MSHNIYTYMYIIVLKQWSKHTYTIYFTLNNLLNPVCNTSIKRRTAPPHLTMSRLLVGSTVLKTYPSFNDSDHPWALFQPCPLSSRRRHRRSKGSNLKFLLRRVASSTKSNLWNIRYWFMDRQYINRFKVLPYYKSRMSLTGSLPPFGKKIYSKSITHLQECRLTWTLEKWKADVRVNILLFIFC